MKKTSSKILSETSKNLLSDVYKRVQKDTSGMKWFKQLGSHLINFFDLLCKSVDWFLHDKDLRHERVNSLEHFIQLAFLNGT